MMSKDGKPGPGTVEYYSISKNKVVENKKIKNLKGKGTDIKPYLVSQENINKYITNKLIKGLIPWTVKRGLLPN